MGLFGGTGFYSLIKAKCKQEIHVQNLHIRLNISHLSINQGLAPHALSNQVKDVKFLVLYILDQQGNIDLVLAF